MSKPHQGADQQEIARAVGRCPSTIRRELRRKGTKGEYFAAPAQRAAERRRRGAFAGDTVLGPAGSGGLVTRVDRKSRFTIVVKIRSQHADHVPEKIKPRVKELDEERRRSITFDWSDPSVLSQRDRLSRHLP